MKKGLLLAIIFLMAACGFWRQYMIEALAQGKSEPSAVYHKYYTSVEIEEGDNLWSIADRYRANSGKSAEEYVKELKRINQLGEDIIYPGHYLAVPYYSAEVK